MNKKLIILSLILAFSLIGCENKKEEVIATIESGENIVLTDNATNYPIVKFSDMYESVAGNKEVSRLLKSLDGKTVQIKGYPAVQSPLDESFVYLNNQQYVTCPFCTIGDTKKLEVIPIYMADGSKIKYTENALNIVGKLEVAEKIDSEGYTTQFRIFADSVTEVASTQNDVEVSNYYATLSQYGMIMDIQQLQMNIEYVTNPDYMKYYDEKYSTGQSTEIDKLDIIKNIVFEYKDRDSSYVYGDEVMGYLGYIEECPIIIKQLEPSNERLKALNNELINLYEKEIIELRKLDEIIKKYFDIDKLTITDANKAYDELISMNSTNYNLFEEYNKWNNKLREN